MSHWEIDNWIPSCGGRMLLGGGLDEVLVVGVGSCPCDHLIAATNKLVGNPSGDTTSWHTQSAEPEPLEGLLHPGSPSPTQAKHWARLWHRSNSSSSATMTSSGASGCVAHVIPAPGIQDIVTAQEHDQQLPCVVHSYSSSSSSGSSSSDSHWDDNSSISSGHKSWRRRSQQRLMAHMQASSFIPATRTSLHHTHLRKRRTWGTSRSTLSSRILDLHSSSSTHPAGPSIHHWLIDAVSHQDAQQPGRPKHALYRKLFRKLQSASKVVQLQCRVATHNATLSWRRLARAVKSMGCHSLLAIKAVYMRSFLTIAGSCIKRRKDVELSRRLPPASSSLHPHHTPSITGTKDPRLSTAARQAAARQLALMQEAASAMTTTPARVSSSWSDSSSDEESDLLTPASYPRALSQPRITAPHAQPPTQTSQQPVVASQPCLNHSSQLHNQQQPPVLTTACTQPNCSVLPLGPDRISRLSSCVLTSLQDGVVREVLHDDLHMRVTSFSIAAGVRMTGARPNPWPCTLHVLTGCVTVHLASETSPAPAHDAGFKNHDDGDDSSAAVSPELHAHADVAAVPPPSAQSSALDRDSAPSGQHSCWGSESPSASVPSTATVTTDDCAVVAELQCGLARVETAEPDVGCVPEEQEQREQEQVSSAAGRSMRESDLNSATSSVDTAAVQTTEADGAPAEAAGTEVHAVASDSRAGSAADTCCGCVNDEAREDEDKEEALAGGSLLCAEIKLGLDTARVGQQQSAGVVAAAGDDDLAASRCDSSKVCEAAGQREEQSFTVQQGSVVALTPGSYISLTAAGTCAADPGQRAGQDVDEGGAVRLLAAQPAAVVLMIVLKH